MCPFFLLHGKEEICSVKGTKRKPVCLKSECNREHIEWLHKILALKGSPDVMPVGSETSGVMNRSGQKRLDDTSFIMVGDGGHRRGGDVLC
jgi:hypothetical protein